MRIYASVSPKTSIPRKVVAYNSNTPAKVLTTLASDYDDYVRRAAYRNSNTPAEVLTTLASDSNGYVRRASYRKS